MPEPFFAPIHDRKFVMMRTAGPVVFLERLRRHRLDHGWRELPANSGFEVHDGSITARRDHFDPSTAAKIHDPPDS